MTIKICEQYKGKRGIGRGNVSRERTYEIIGTRDCDTAYTEFYQFVMENAPTFKGLPIETIDVEENEDGAKLCIGTVKYSNLAKQRLGIGIPKYKFSTKGGTAKVRFSLETLKRIGRDGRTPPNFHGGINYQSGKYEGVDIVVPKWTKTVSIRYLRSMTGFQFERMVFGMTGTVNSHPFLGMAPGEVIFNGVDVDDSDIETEDGYIIPTSDCVFEFNGMPNRNNMYAGDLGPFDKGGWDYVWEYYRETPDFLSKNTIHISESIQVERMYTRNDFNVLGF